MKKWKLLILALFIALLACACMPGLAEDDCKHPFLGSEVTTVPTCKTEGVRTFSCPTCGKTWTETIARTNTHTKNAGTVTKEATCSETGIKVYKCSVCGVEMGSEAIPAKGHTWDAGTVAKEATCTATGIKSFICTVCKATKTEAIPALNHDLVNVAYVEPTCNAKGNTAGQRCTRCNYTTVTEIAATGKHKFDVIASDHKDATCTEAGYNEFTCVYCKTEKSKTVLPALGHNYPTAWTVTTPATCQAAGVESKSCTRCGNVVTQATAKAAHDYKDETIITPATCEAAGSKKLTCTMCKADFITQTIPALGHDFSGDPVVVEATCKAAGTKTWTCKHGGCTKTKVETIAKLAHKYEIETIATPATCETNGVKKITCSLCKEDFITQYIPATGHDYSGDPVVVEPTCKAAGTRTWTCKHGGCTKPKVETIAKLAHKYEIETVVDKPTCDKKGRNKLTCSLCKEDFILKDTPALGHDFSGAPVVKDATCEEAGTKTWTCTHEGCTQTKVQTIKKLGHKSTYKVTKEATCTEAGTKDQVCERCGKVLKSNVKINKLGHKLKDVVTKEPDCENAGTKNVVCERCNAVTQENVAIKKLGHKGVWVTVKKPTKTEDGEAVETCSRCGKELGRKKVPYAIMMYNNTICSLGPCTRDLIGGDDWYRVTPLDLSVEGSFTYPLIATNKFTVGTMTVTISNGAMTVTYKLNSNQFNVRSEALVFYSNLEALRKPTTENTFSFSFGQPIDIAQTFGEDTRVILSFFMKADYDQLGNGVYGFQADARQINEMVALID